MMLCRVVCLNIEVLTPSKTCLGESWSAKKRVWGGGRATLDESNVRRWVNKFKTRETIIDNKLCSGRPATVVIYDNRQQINDMICVARRMYVKFLRV